MLVVPSSAAMSLATFGAAAVCALVAWPLGPLENPAASPGAYTVSWLEGRLGPVESRALTNLAALATQMMPAISVLRLIAASAGPDRARYRARSRSASRTAIGLHFPAAATTDRSAGASSTMATVRAMKPTARSSVWVG